MRARVIILIILLIAVLGLSYELYRIEKRYLTPRVKEVEKEVIKKVGVGKTPEEIRTAATAVTYVSRVKSDKIEIQHLINRADGTVDTIFKPVFIKGVNFGPAIPGTYPAQFAPSREDYERWFEEMGDVGFNAVRVYTVLPPDFYSALASYNMKHSSRKIYLFQGIWVPVPDSEDYLNEQFDLQIKKEIERAVDAIHGSNGYFTDVSGYTIGFIFGREWEPDGVLKTTRFHPQDTTFAGNFISIPRGNPMEIWLARMLDYIQTYETVTYSMIHPVSFVNWLTLDPLYHISEFIESPKVREYDNDLLTVDPSRFYRTEVNPVGFFASYHIYPYYPDFINNEYKDFRGRYGKDNYEGYLNALKKATDGLPILVAEFGVPSSRGIGHYNPFGMNQGGHSEVEQGIIDFHLFRDIADQGYAGGLLFEWMDEWFKRNWLFMDFENPMNRNPLWHNIYDAEQTFGLISFDPKKIKIDGDPEDWTNVIPYLESNGAVKSFSIFTDPVYIYFKIELKKKFNPDSEIIRIFIDTYDSKLGEFYGPGKRYAFQNGVEFIVELSKTGRILVEKSYNVYRDWIHDIFSPMRTERSNRGEFVEPSLQANRERITLLGDTIPGKKFYPGRLIFGKEENNSLADWYYKGNIVELRIGWNALNVTDPSSLHVLQNDPETPDIDATVTDGFSFSIGVFNSKGQVVGALPGYRNGTFEFSPRFKWNGWNSPYYEEHKKKSFFVLKDSLKSLTPLWTESSDTTVGSSKPTILQYKGYNGFATFSFDDGDVSQFNHAFPILEKYKARGSFGIVTSWLSDHNMVAGPPGELKLKRLSKSQVKALSESGEEISSHGHIHALEIFRLPEDSIIRQFNTSRNILETVTGSKVFTLHMPYSREFKKVIDAARKSGFQFVRVGDDEYNSVNFDPFDIKSFVIYTDSNPEVKKYYNILMNGKDKWVVFMYHHVFPQNSFELKLMKAHNVRNTYSILPITFERHVRIARDLKFDLVTIKEAGFYLENYRKAKLHVTNASGIMIVSVKNTTIPMFVSLPLPRGVYKVENSTNDGIYEIRKKPLIIAIPPRKSTIIYRLK